MAFYYAMYATIKANLYEELLCSVPRLRMLIVAVIVTVYWNCWSDYSKMKLQ